MLAASLSNAICVQVDVSAPLAYAMAAKDETELITMKKACQATMDLFTKFLKEQLMDLIDKDKVSHFYCSLSVVIVTTVNSFLFLSASPCTC